MPRSDGRVLGLEPPEADYCPVFQSTIELVGRRWSGSVLRALLSGPHRFCEISESIPGISHRLLAQRLAELTSAGLIEPDPGGYRLTDKGQDLRAVFAELDDWNRRWIRG